MRACAWTSGNRRAGRARRRHLGSTARCYGRCPGDVRRAGQHGGRGVASAVAVGPARWGYRWVILGAAHLAQTTVAFPSQSLSPLAPFLMADLGLSRAQVGLLSTAYYF